MPQPVSYASKELDLIRAIVRKHMDATGETAGDIADRAEVPRQFLYRIMGGSYAHSPKLEDISRILEAIGYRVAIQKK